MTFKSRVVKSVLTGVVVCMMCVGTFTVAAGAEGSIGAVLGDANRDGEITINDVTTIQRSIARQPVGEGFSVLAADVDGSGTVDITDATTLQRWLAGINVPYSVGTFVEMPTDSNGWGRIIFQP